MDCPAYQFPDACLRAQILHQGHFMNYPRRVVTCAGRDVSPGLITLGRRPNHALGLRPNWALCLRPGFDNLSKDAINFMSINKQAGCSAAVPMSTAVLLADRGYLDSRCYQRGCRQARHGFGPPIAT